MALAGRGLGEARGRTTQARSSKRKGARVRTLLSKLGPGLITGASDDDPSGIGTYSIAGAQLGYSPLWTALLLFPLMFSVQLMCARIGMVSGEGLAALIRKRYGGWVLRPVCCLVVVANTVNVAADLGAMAAATGMITGIRPAYLTPLFTAWILATLFFWPYPRIARWLKWTTITLFAYVIAAFRAHPNWASVAYSSFAPKIELSPAFLSTLVALAGTTISPYLFFWQASQEVEEDRAKGKRTIAQRRGATDEETADSRFDVFVGILFSQLIMYFVILTTAATLNAHGGTHISTVQEAAEALRPLAGNAAYLLFTAGIVGTGLLSVPVLAGSTAFAVAEAASSRSSLTYRPKQAPLFYGVLGATLVVGLALNYLGFDVIGMLFWSAVINGLLAPPVLILVVLLSANRTVMGERVSSGALRVFGWIAIAVMAAAELGLLWSVHWKQG